MMSVGKLKFRLGSFGSEELHWGIYVVSVLHEEINEHVA